MMALSKSTLSHWAKAGRSEVTFVVVSWPNLPKFSGGRASVCAKNKLINGGRCRDGDILRRRFSSLQRLQRSCL